MIAESANSIDTESAQVEQTIMLEADNLRDKFGKGASTVQIRTAAETYADQLSSVIKDDGTFDDKNKQAVSNVTRGIRTYLSNLDQDGKDEFATAFMGTGNFSKGKKEAAVRKLLAGAKDFSEEELQANADKVKVNTDPNVPYKKGNIATGKKTWNIAYDHYKEAYELAKAAKDKKIGIRSLAAMLQSRINMDKERGEMQPSYRELDMLLEMSPKNRWALNIKKKLKSGTAKTSEEVQQSSTKKTEGARKFNVEQSVKSGSNLDKKLDGMRDAIISMNYDSTKMSKYEGNASKLIEQLEETGVTTDNPVYGKAKAVAFMANVANKLRSLGNDYSESDISDIETEFGRRYRGDDGEYYKPYRESFMNLLVDKKTKAKG